MEIDALFDGYVRRQERLEDLFIINCALPTYRGAYGRKAPSYRKLTSHRVKHSSHGKVGTIDEGTQNFWRGILTGGLKSAKQTAEEKHDL